MTMMKREPDSVWNRVREDRDVDDLIFGEEFSVYREQSQPCGVFLYFPENRETFRHLEFFYWKKQSISTKGGCVAAQDILQ